VIRPFRSRITRIALGYVGVTPESNPAAFAQKMEELKGQRDQISAALKDLLIPALEAGLRQDVDQVVIDTFAHNATRVTPDGAWLAPAA